jgi:oligopeptidase B
VQYWEPAKWVAKLRELKTDNNLLLLCTDMDSGHGGKSGRFKSYEGVALEFAGRAGARHAPGNKAD